MSTETELLGTLAAACDGLAAAARAATPPAGDAPGLVPAAAERIEAAAGRLLAAVEALANVSGGLTMAAINHALQASRAEVVPPGTASKDDYLRLCLAPADRPRHA
jgi:hypothetical protein